RSVACKCGIVSRVRNEPYPPSVGDEEIAERVQGDIPRRIKLCHRGRARACDDEDCARRRPPEDTLVPAVGDVDSAASVARDSGGQCKVESGKRNRSDQTGEETSYSLIPAIGNINDAGEVDGDTCRIRKRRGRAWHVFTR